MTAIIFSALSVLAIVAGGLISAFLVHRPPRFRSWLSAYLVLVVGIVQLGLVNAWHRLGQPADVIATAAFFMFNLGNLSVIAGTMVKARTKRYPVLVNSGGLLIALAMILLLFAVRNSKTSWTLAEFIVLLAVILVSVPIGLVLSGRRRKAS